MHQPLHRRTVLKCIVAVAASATFGCEDDSPITEERRYFPQSVASGDPRPDSVVLWTRAVDPDRPEEDVRLTLQVSQDEDFERLVVERRNLRARAEHDHIVKVKVKQLNPRTRYFYRFVVEQENRRLGSATGRTRTAPAGSSTEPVRFAIANCQDFAGRYYNSWQRLVQLDEDLDFIVFLGDYIYEVPPPPVSPPTTERTVEFSDPPSALPIRPGLPPTLAAASLSNYRDLYKRYRSDPFLQQAHERYPFINVWDDHEYSNDSWGAHETYTPFNIELVERRRNAEQAYFEYQPIDPTDAPTGAIDVGNTPRYPETRIWRDFDFGRTLRLLVTDTRTRRPDHLIPEDAYPATVVMDQTALQAAGVAAGFASDVFAYVDISQPQYESQRIALQQAYAQLAVQAGLSQADATARAQTLVTGNLALAYVNPVLAQLGQPPIAPTGQPRGIAWAHMGKRDLFGAVGSRHIVVKDVYDVYAAWRYAANRASQDVLGAEQESWLREAVTAQQTWKVMVSSVSMTTMLWDLRNKPDVTDPALRNRFYFSADQWDGFPTKKRELLNDLRVRSGGNLLVVSGDIHASFASVEEGVPAVTGPAISSSSVRTEAAEAVVAAGYPPESPVYRYVITEQEATLREGNPGIAFVDTDSHGFTIVELRADEALALATYHLIPSTEVGVDYSGQPEALETKFTRRDFRIRDGAITPA